MQYILVYLPILALVACCAQNQMTWADQGSIITGIVSKVRDGDTVEVGGVPVRLNGVSAPELNEDLGQVSKLFMIKLVLRKRIQCKLTGKKSYDRHVGTCYLGNLDIGAAVIKAGFALDCQKYSRGRYKAFETEIGRSQIRLPAYCR